MKKIYHLISFLLVLCLLGSQIYVQAEDDVYEITVNPTLGSSGVVYPSDPELSMVTDEYGYAWLVQKNMGSVSLFQYDLTRIPQGVTVTKAEWKVLVNDTMAGTPPVWTADFTSFVYEDSFSQAVDYIDAQEMGYTLPNSEPSNCFLTKAVKTADYTLEQYSEYKGVEIGTVYGTANCISFDMTEEVNKFLKDGRSKFNFGVTQSTNRSSVRIPTVWEPAPQLVLTIELDSNQSVDNYTTTRYNDYFLNLHPTSPIQIAAGICGGEAGQAGQAIAISPSNPQMMVCGNDMAGVYASNDGGENWKITGDGLMTIGVSDLFFDPADSNIVLALGTTTQPRRSHYPGIYRSTDAGKTWSLVRQLPVAQRDGRYFQAGKPVNGVYPIYAGTNSSGILSGLYVSYDHGATWHPRGLDTQIISDVYADGDFLAVSTSTSGLFFSYNGGIGWQRVKINSGLPRTGMKAFVKDPSNPLHMFAADAAELYETTDGGENWIVINSAEQIGVEELEKLEMMEDPNNANNYILYVGTSKPGPSVRYSEDNGQTFQAAVVHSELSFMTDVIGYIAEPIEIDHGTKTIFAFFDGDLHKSTDGGRNFYPSMSGYSGMRSRDYVFDANDPYYLGIAQTDRGFMQTVEGYTGSEYKPFDYSIVLAAGRYGGARTVFAAEKDPSDSNHIIICMGGISGDSIHALKRTTDNGKTWSVIPESETYSKWSGINRIYFHPDNSDIIYAGYLKSIDGGETWEDLGVMVSAMSPTNGDIVYNIGTSAVSISTDGGSTWEQVADGITTSQRGLVDSTDPYTLYVGTFNSGLYKIDANTKTKTAINSGMKKSEGILNIKDIAQDPSDPKHLICGGANNYTYAKSEGIFESLDGGESWRVVEGLPGSRDVWVVEFHPALPKVYIGTSAGTFIYEWKNNPANGSGIN